MKTKLSAAKKAIKILRSASFGPISHQGRSDASASRLEFIEVDLRACSGWRVVFCDQCTTVGRRLCEVTRSKKLLAAEAVLDSLAVGPTS
jgi:hypothetical protein